MIPPRLASVHASKTVLVTGGRGFIGRAVVRLLRGESYRVVSLDTVGSASGDEVRCDLTEPNELRAIFNLARYDAIIHLAAVLPTAADRDPVLATKVNVNGSSHLLEMTRDFRTPRFLFGSSLSIYGTWSSSKVVREADRAAPEDIYGASKLYVEQLGSIYADQHNLEFATLRIGRVLGPGSGSRTSAWRSELFEQLGAERKTNITIPYRASERLLVLHVEDVARMFLALVSAPRIKYRIYNAPCESMTVEQLRSAIEKLNTNINIVSGDSLAAKNPKRVDDSRFRREFHFRSVPLTKHLRDAAHKRG